MSRKEEHNPGIIANGVIDGTRTHRDDEQAYQQRRPLEEKLVIRGNRQEQIVRRAHTILDRYAGYSGYKVNRISQLDQMVGALRHLMADRYRNKGTAQPSTSIYREIASMKDFLHGDELREAVSLLSAEYSDLLSHCQRFTTEVDNWSAVIGAFTENRFGSFGSLDNGALTQIFEKLFGKKVSTYVRNQLATTSIFKYLTRRRVNTTDYSQEVKNYLDQNFAPIQFNNRLFIIFSHLIGLARKLQAIRAHFATDPDPHIFTLSQYYLEEIAILATEIDWQIKIFKHYNFSISDPIEHSNLPSELGTEAAQIWQDLISQGQNLRSPNQAT